jgi:uncharacterized protein (TIGR02246 family)
MKRFSLPRAAVLLAFLIFSSATHLFAADVKSVLKADRQRLDAMLAADAAAVEKALTADCLYVHSYGSAQTKEEFVAAFRKGALAYRKLDYAGEPRVRFFGETTAVITGQMNLEVVNAEGRVLKPTLLLTAVYVLQDGAWKLASYQSTPAATSTPR